MKWKIKSMLETKAKLYWNFFLGVAHSKGFFAFGQYNIREREREKERDRAGKYRLKMDSPVK